MKKFFLMAVAAIAAMTMTVSCDDYEPDTFFGEVKVSSSYVTFTPAGSSTTITVNTTDKWAITEIPEWLTIAPASGAAGKSTVTFTAPEAKETRSASVKLTVGDKCQIINVLQQCAKVETPLSACSEVLAGPDSKTYKTKGVVTAIANTVYGNFYINDGTGEVYIYGTLYAGKTQNNPIVNNNIEVGDEVTVEGPKTTYNGTVELVDVTVISVDKSLIKCDSTAVAGVVRNELPSDGGEIVAFLSNKGNGLFVDVPADAQSWLSISSIAGNQVAFKASANTAGPRNTTLVFRTTDGKKNYTAEVAISQAGLSGTLELPMTVEEAIKAANAGVTSSVYVKGIVSELVSGGYGANYGNGSFWISADGVKSGDLTRDFEVYQANWLEGAKWTEANPQIAVGAEVIVFGPLTVYKGTAETQGKGAAYVYSVNGVTSDANGIGSVDAPFNAVGAIAAANAGASSTVYIQGTISQIVKTGFDPAYGNGSFWISTDGTYNNDLSKDFELYQVNWLEGAKWTEANPQLVVGDNVVVCGPLTVYKGTAETQGKGAAYIYKYAPAAAK